MKKAMLGLISTLLLAAVLLGGCSSKSQVGPVDLDVYTAARELVDMVSFRDTLIEAQQPVAEQLYQLEGIEKSGVYISGSGATAEDVAVLQVAAVEDIDTAKAALEKRVEDLKLRFEDYVPNEMKKLGDPVIVTKGNIAVLVIADDAAQAKKAVNDLLG